MGLRVPDVRTRVTVGLEGIKYSKVCYFDIECRARVESLVKPRHASSRHRRFSVAANALR